MIDLDNQEIDSIIDLLRLRKGTDLRNYARASLNRRVNRFFELKKLTGVKDFQQRIQNEEGFADTFIEEVTVNVTEMFRDPGFWIEIKNTVLPKLSGRNTIRIWHAACSTGEEVYSMAILLKEAGLYEKCRIVGSDLNSNALKISETGVYPVKNQVVNERNYNLFSGVKRLHDYYERKDNLVHYDPQLIKNVSFKRHDLVKDPSFGTFDLIICRNVLIYFNFNLQEKVLNLFTESLLPGSFMGIGSKESINWTRADKHFKTICLEEKIYKKLETKENSFNGNGAKNG
jgi:chemotaxis protein methyltransferase CheR